MTHEVGIVDSTGITLRTFFISNNQEVTVMNKLRSGNWRSGSNAAYDIHELRQFFQYLTSVALLEYDVDTFWSRTHMTPTRTTPQQREYTEIYQRLYDLKSSIFSEIQTTRLQEIEQLFLDIER
jgi:hypothetical protein